MKSIVLGDGYFYVQCLVENAKMPSLKMPNLKMPSDNMQSLKIPSIQMSSLKMPSLSMQSLKMPSFKMIFKMNIWLIVFFFKCQNDHTTESF